MELKNWKLSPSDFAFLWDECKRCFYLKIARGFGRPATPFPGIFSKIAALEKAFFDGKHTESLTAQLPPGRVTYGEKWVRSAPISFSGLSSSCFISGRFDNVVQFDDGAFAVIDFKTAETKAEHVDRYSRQLHAYAYALEHPAPGALSLSPVTRLGLLCLEPNSMFASDAEFGFRCAASWIECPRDDGAFLAFLEEVLSILGSPDPPGGSPSCPFCQYRDTARRTGL
jgi:hypothetical protein